MNDKYGNFLTILLIVIIVAIIGLIGYFSYDVYKKYTSEQEANDFVNNFTQQIKPDDSTKPTEDPKPDGTAEGENSLDNVEQIETKPDSEGKKETYQGFKIVGTIEIPAIRLAYPIIEKASISAIETSVAMLYGPGPNKAGNTVIVGHNYRNGKFFSNNKKLSIGDKIYITDLSGSRLSYTIYDKFEVADNDSEYMLRSTNGAREISLSTCTDDGNNRLIIEARCDLD